ncbi:MAG: sigma 54-interacting transcriptional regulator [Bdellovibrionia bacterium]
MNQQLFLINEQNPEQKFALLKYQILGSSSDCNWTLSGLSEQQLRIEMRDGIFMLRNLSPSVSLYSNDQEVIECPLREGDRIRLAGYQFYVSAQEATATHPKIKLHSKNEDWQKELQMLELAAQTEFPILLLGQSGTGKDVLANELHNISTRRNGPFVSVNCSALTETLVESELFGHVKGSFTGATHDRKGAFETARGGTLFLDEIGDLSKNLQAKILRALENQEIRPVGSDQTVRTDVRIIAATHQDLEEKIVEGHFRSDLYFRLNVVSTRTPALHERMEDFEELLYTFCKLYKLAFSFDAIQELKKYSWPGNIRELKNTVARASALFPNTRISVEHVSRLVGNVNKNALPTVKQELEFVQEMPVIKEIEKQLILKRLKANRGNQRRTAAELKMPKSTLFDRLKYYQIDPQDFKV